MQALTRGMANVSTPRALGLMHLKKTCGHLSARNDPALASGFDPPLGQAGDAGADPTKFSEHFHHL